MQRFLRFAVGIVAHPISLALCFVFREGIHYIALEIIVLKEQVGVLRVDIYQSCGQGFELQKGNHTVVHEGARFPVGIEFAADDYRLNSGVCGGLTTYFILLY